MNDVRRLLHILKPYRGLAVSSLVMLVAMAALNGNSSIRAGEGGVRDLREALFVKIQAFTSPLRQLANLHDSIQAALAGDERVSETLDSPPEMDDARKDPAAPARTPRRPRGPRGAREDPAAPLPGLRASAPLFP